MKKASDSQIIRHVQRGNKNAFDALVIKHQPKLLKLVTGYTKDTDTAMDVTQDSLFKAYRALARFRGDRTFYTWLYRITVNTCINYLVSSKRNAENMELSFDDPDNLVDFSTRFTDVDTPEAILISEQLKLALSKAIKQLPKELKVVFTLRNLEHKNYEDIASELGCPVGTVKSRLHRARQIMRKKIERFS